MREFIRSIFIALILMPIGTMVGAVGVSETCTPAGTVTGIIQCDANLFCAPSKGDYSCKECPSDYPTSIVGATEDTKCYKIIECKDDPIENGIKIPEKDKLNAYKGSTEPQCQYPENLIQCNNPTMNAGYHRVGATCVSNTGTCNLYSYWVNNAKTGTAEKYWNTGTSAFGTCNQNPKCDTGYHVTKTIYLGSDPFPTETKTGLWCNPNTVSCQTSPIWPNLKADGGDAKWKSSDVDILLYYDLSECFQNQTNNTSFGNGRKKCFYSDYLNGSAVYNKDCTDFDMTACIGGYYYDKSTKSDDCIPTTPGHYSPSSSSSPVAVNLTQADCEGGLTSNAGSTLASQCFIKGGSSGTKFCDSQGCFYLPSNVLY